MKESDLLNGFNSMGLYFEDMAAHDLYVYSGALGTTLKHHRDWAGREADAILIQPSEEYATIAIKLGNKKDVSSGIKSLKSFLLMLEKEDKPKAKFSMVLVTRTKKGYMPSLLGI
jgi:hypothetical protein